MKPVIGVTMGDPSGIGPEIVLKSLMLHDDIYEICTPIIFGNSEVFNELKVRYNFDVNIITIDKIDSQIKPAKNRIYCLCKEESGNVPKFAEINAESASMAFGAIENSITSAMNGDISAIATAPINKEALKKAQIPFLDHTEIFTKGTNSKNIMTLFITGKLKIFFLTTHLRFCEISAALRIDDIVLQLKNSYKYLKKLGVKSPKIALAALNPHAGEGGMFGDEEIGVLVPAVSLAKNLGINVHGPIAADSVFHFCNEGKYDAVLSLYHDQGHIAAKTLDFYRTISVNMGLPFLRTSVVHGTAMDIAGENRANESGMVEAIKYAAKYSWENKKTDDMEL
jgi:4-hydroxythreonine-4-phosphate dehydrogenase